MSRLWHSRSAIPPSICPECGAGFLKRSPRQKFCTIKCQGRDSEKRRPPRIWGTKEFYARRALLSQGLKKCKQCAGVFLLGEFWSAGTTRSPYCKICASSRQRTKRKPDTNLRGRRERSRRWRMRHPEIKAEYSRVRRAIKANGGAFLVTSCDLGKLWARQRGICYLCSRPIEEKRNLDHIFPIGRGGRHAIGNLAWTHSGCNLSKGCKLLVEFKYRGIHESSITVNA